jgi:hypothetical protein
MSLLRPHPVLVAVVDLVLDLYARSPQLQCRMMRSFHPEQGLVLDSPLSILYLLLNRSRCRLWVLLLCLLRLGAESAGEHVRWVGAIWYVPSVSAIL